MKNVRMVMFLGLVAFASSISGANAAGWTCTAKALKNSYYNGGDTAMIHLFGFSSGGNYPVNKVSANKVTGTTKNGTPFTCTKK